MNLTQLRARLVEIDTERQSIHVAAGDANFTDEQNSQWDVLQTERDDLERQIATAETEERRAAAREEQRAQFARALANGDGQVAAVPGDGARIAAPEVMTRVDPFAVLEDRSLHGVALERALVGANLKAMEGREVGGAENEKQFERLLKRHAEDPRWSQNVLARQKPEYVSAFAKLVTGRDATLTEAERAAMTVGTNTAGGYLVPTHLDPTLMLTNAGSSNVMRQYARQVTLTEGNVWNGVTTAGATASWDAEVTEVSDDTPAIGRESITLNKPQAFIQASIEAFEDIAGLTADVMMIFADARDRLEGSGHMTGLGSSNQPLGLFTAINASASLQVVSTTAAVIGEVDIHALYRALPVRFRNRGSFVLNPLYNLAIKRLGTAVSSSYSGDLREAVTDRILARAVVETDDAPTVQTTTALDLEVVFADLNQYIIVDKPGSTSIEFMPHMLGSNRLPNGARGWYMWWRTGAGMPVLNGGRVLVDKTSA